MIACYILYNPVLDSFYTGFTQDDILVRLESHKSGKYDGSYTKNDPNWVLYIVIECVTVPQALKIEKHIKRMKSRKYIENLKIYPEIIEKLKVKYG